MVGIDVSQVAQLRTGGEDEEQLRVVSAVDVAERILQQRVLSGKIGAGENVRESRLASELGIARHTLRAALSRLESAGLLQRQENRGWSVPVLHRREHEDILLLRGSLESSAYRIMLRDGILPDNRVETALAELISLGDDATWPKRLEVDANLHLALVDLAGSPRLSRVFEQMLFELRLCRLQSLSWLEQVGLEVWKQLHIDLVEQVRRGDAAALLDDSTHYARSPWADEGSHG